MYVKPKVEILQIGGGIVAQLLVSTLIHGKTGLGYRSGMVLVLCYWARLILMVTLSMTVYKWLVY